MDAYTYENFAYFDTNILSELAKKIQKKGIPSVWTLRDYLLEQNLAIAISEAHMLELSDAYKLHEALAILLVTLPSAIIKSRETILAEEVKAHPAKRQEALMLQAINPMLLQPSGIETVKNSLFSQKAVGKARSKQLQQAQQMPKEHSKLKANFPVSKQGKFIKEQADEFANMMLMQALAGLHRPFLMKYKDNIINLRFENFLSIRLRATAIFYKYYLGQRTPKRESELGDFGHLFYVPFCKLAVMEKDLNETLHQIQRNYRLIDDIELHNIKWMRNLLETTLP